MTTKINNSAKQNRNLKSLKKVNIVKIFIFQVSEHIATEARISLARNSVQYLRIHVYMHTLAHTCMHLKVHEYREWENVESDIVKLNSFI